MRYDFAIIGGGIAGVSAAATLAPLGCTVLLEREDHLATQASGRSAAMLLLDYGNDVVRALNHASAPEHKTAGVLSPRGMLLLGKDSEAEIFEREAAELGLAGVSLDDAQRMLPILNTDRTAHAAYRADAYDLDTDRLIQFYLRSAKAAGADIRTKQDVTTIAQTQTGWRITPADQDPIEARTIINAGGAWADAIATMAGVAPIGLTPYRRSMALIPAPNGLDTADWPFIDGAGEAWYAKPQSGKLIVSPSEEFAMDPHDAFADDMVIAEGLARYEDMMTSPVTRVETTWAGLRTFAPDRALVIGRDPVHPSFAWLAGQGGYGFQTSPAAAALLGQILSGTPTTLDASLVQALNPIRFS